MKINFIPLQNMARSADLVNTINGGMSMAYVKVDKEESEWIAQIRVPGVGVEDIRIEVRDQYLLVFQEMKMSGDDLIVVPYLITMLELSNKVDEESIIAEYENGLLSVTLPMDKPSGGKERQIEIILK